MIISETRWNKLRHPEKKGYQNGNPAIFLETEVRWQEVKISKTEPSPTYGDLTLESPWEGVCQKKPWEYEITAVIPVLNTSETLPICIELLRLQTNRPYILIIDTGSIEEHLEKTIQMRDVDVEVHSLVLNGVQHPSDYPAMAMDVAFTLCRTPYLFATHADCFLRRRDFLDYLLDLCRTKSPACGYELSPRAHADWKGMLSHTASMYKMSVMDDIGFGWSLRRLCHSFGITSYKPNPMRSNWPDTEILGNYILKKNNIVPYLIGGEGNQVRTLDENIDHFKSYTSGKMYSPPYYRTVNEWYQSAVKDALERIENWRREKEEKQEVI